MPYIILFEKKKILYGYKAMTKLTLL